MHSSESQFRKTRELTKMLRAVYFNAGGVFSPQTPGAHEVTSLGSRFMWALSWKGTNGVSTNGVTANCMFFDRDLLGTPVHLLLSSQRCHGVPFSPNCRNSLLLQRPHKCCPHLSATNVCGVVII